jgi:hypothetical protein
LAAGRLVEFLLVTMEEPYSNVVMSSARARRRMPTGFMARSISSPDGSVALVTKEAWL